MLYTKLMARYLWGPAYIVNQVVAIAPASVRLDSIEDSARSDSMLTTGFK
jgi:hypothetical protein